MSQAKSSRLSQAELQKALQKKRECNAKAQAVVEAMLERPVTSTDFLSKLQYINQNHYDDIVEERCILRLCGYALCENNLENVPLQRYIVSTVHNKVYDITNRKKFCSPYCYKASDFIRAQILVSPLWLRVHEQMPEFKLLEK